MTQSLTFAPGRREESAERGRQPRRAASPFRLVRGGARKADAENVLLVPEPGRGIGGRTGRVFPGPSSFRDVVREKTQNAGPAGRVETRPADGRVEAGEHGFPAFPCVIESTAADEGGDSALCNGPEADAGEEIPERAERAALSGAHYFTGSGGTHAAHGVEAEDDASLLGAEEAKGGINRRGKHFGTAFPAAGEVAGESFRLAHDCNASSDRPCSTR